jgi:hypothetical protein
MAAWLVTAAGAWPARAAEGADPQVTASSVHPGDYAPHYALDRNMQSRWASAGFRGGPEWIQIDLGQPVGFDTLVIHWERAYAAEYDIQVSDDGEQWRTMHEQREGKGEREAVGGLAARGRYVRVLCRKPGPFGLFSVWEIQFPDGEASRVLAEARRRAEEARRKADSEAVQPVLGLLREQGVEEIVFALRQPGKDGHWYANFGYFAEDENRLTYGPGGKLCRMRLDTGEVTVLLDDPLGGVRDPVVHYDAGKILFSYRKGESPHYHLYEIDADGSNPRQLTDGPYDDIEPCYLPDGRIVFVSSRCHRWVNCWLTQVGILYRCEADGSGIHPLSANVEHDNTPWTLPDGRILYQRWEYIDRSQVDYHHLWTANPDGTGQMVFYGNKHPGILMIDAKPVPESRKVVAIFSPGHGRREHDGVVTLVDPRRGPDDRESARAITREPNYRDPWAFSEEAFMAAQGRRIALLNAEGQSLEIFRVRPDEEAAGLECHEPRPLIRRPRERIIPDRTDPRFATGAAMVLDVYEGRNMEGAERGDIKKLLVIESLPKPINFTGGMDPLTYGGSFTLERILGTVPVEPDGSAYMELPALRSLFFVALDGNDMAVKRMHSFMTVQPGEVVGCVGCHEHRTQTLLPPDFATALARRPSRIEPMDGYPDVLDFPRDIQPILDALCADCHGTEQTARGGPYDGGILLTGDRGPMFSHAYFSMTVHQLFNDNRNTATSNHPPRTIGSSASRILQMLDGSHYDVKATERQKTMLRLWIEVGAPYPGTYAALGSGSIGGYHENRLVNTDFDWPTTQAGAEVIDRRCASCHQDAMVLPRSLSDERGISFWRFSIDDPRLRLSRHIVFNLTRPERSLLLLAPLAKDSGGLDLCRDAEGRPAGVFAGSHDSDYQTLLAMIAAGKRNLDGIKRFDMPGFQPVPQYLREMQRYGVLPADHPDDAPVDPYELDQRYWRSLWHEAARER